MADKQSSRKAENRRQYRNWQGRTHHLASFFGDTNPGLAGYFESLFKNLQNVDVKHAL